MCSARNARTSSWRARCSSVTVSRIGRTISDKLISVQLHGGEQSAVRTQRGADEVGGVVRGEEGDGGGDLLGRAEAARGGAGDLGDTAGAEARLQPRGVDEPGRDGVDADALDDQPLG